jgi:hypothetical protein
MRRSSVGWNRLSACLSWGVERRVTDVVSTGGEGGDDEGDGGGDAFARAVRPVHTVDMLMRVLAHGDGDAERGAKLDAHGAHGA